MSKKRHVHSGRSSRGFLDADGILGKAGLEEGLAVLDIGCGDGYFSMAAAKVVGTTGRVYALDSFNESIKKLEEELKEKGITNIEPVLADATKNIPLPDESIDFCLMVNVLHGFVANEEIKSTMDEISRVLKTGGELVIVDFKKERSLHGPPFSIRLDSEEVDEIIIRYGYVKGLTEEVGENHYLKTFQKSDQ